jgi:hypothetical protein
MSHKLSLITVLTVFALLVTAGVSAAQAPAPDSPSTPALPLGSAFTYQGRLTDNGAPATGIYDFQFALYNAGSGGVPVGSTVVKQDVPVAAGLFTVLLDFGPSPFGTQALWLEIQVRPGASTGAFSRIDPRQQLTSTPTALYAPSSGNADLLDGLQANAFALANHTHPTWNLGGNAGTNPATNYLGTSDPVALTFKVGGVTALRILPDINSPNIIGGSGSNQVVSGTIGAVIAGGGAPAAINKAQGNYSVIGGGVGNITNGVYATVAGGVQNTASSSYAAIGGGWKNTASGSESTVAGGAYNSATDSVATVGGGGNNTASGYISTIGGGTKNSSDGDYSTIAGGDSNSTSAPDATVAGGYKNNVTGDFAAIGGGSGNAASGMFAVIGGGGGTLSGAVPNKASDVWSTVGGGRSNTASGPAATVGGGDGNTASAVTSTVPGGSGNTASGPYSFAAGAQASATHGGSFVWSSYDATTSWGDNTFTVRAHGGTRFYSAPGTAIGVQLSSGATSWGSISDRNVKQNFSNIDSQWLLEQIAAMPIQTWNLKSQAAGMRHIGPVAQDFNGMLSSLFGTVEDPLRINNMDAVGVSLAAIQGLYAQNQQQAAQIKALQDKLSAQSTNLAASEPASLPVGWLMLIGALAVVVLAQAGMFFFLLRKMRGRL